MTTRHVHPRTTLVTGAAVVLLWGVSFALSYVDLGAAALPVALAIAAAKAALVGLVFMELVVEPLSIRLAICSALFMVALLVGLMAADVATRAEPPLLPASNASVAR